MTALPEQALQQLICFSCKKYLSVFPIKVYPNKNVKCGRCCDSNEDDGGTVSHLYEHIAKQIGFPCVNRFEGCKEVLGPNEMKKHEKTCLSDDYQCPICADFNGPSFNLLNHMKINHEHAFIETQDFLIELHDVLKSETFFYCGNSCLVLVKYWYDASSQEITLSLEVIGGQRSSGMNTMYTFMLYSIENKLQYKSGIIESSKGGLDCKGLQIDIAKLRYPKNILICKFQLWDSAMMLKKYQFDKKEVHVQCELPPVYDKSNNKAILIFTMDDIGTCESDSCHNSKHQYWLGDQLWWLYIEKKVHDTIEYMGIYLSKKKSDTPCKVKAEITLRSLLGNKFNNSLTLERLYSAGNSWGWAKFIKWNDLNNAKKGYVNPDNTIEIHVLLEVLPTEVPKCSNCEKPCLSCAT